MSFGFSVGDFIAVGKLIADITSSLQGSSVAEYRELILELHGLQRALREIEHLPCPPGREAVTNSIKVAALMCQYPLDEFAAKLKKFESLTDAPEQTSRRATVKRIGDKVKWRFKMADEVSNLRAYLIAHVGSLNMRLMTEGLKSASMAVEETGKARMDISSGIESVSTALATTHELVIQGDILTRSNNSILIRLSKLVTRDMLPQLRQLIELTKNIWNSNLKIITILTDIQTSGPVPNLQYTWFQEPVRFEDAMGRVFPVPSEYTWGKLRAVLVEQFRNGPGYEKVLAGEFELFNSMDSTQDISGHEDSETLIPGMRITMAIIIGQYDWRGSNRCPRPGCKSTTFEPHKGGGSSW
ncbi:hypothetical protein M501DRAFT_942486 [Patellaria atrata CBS 101060]|uniref:Ubiquitin-like domain-containing protein n=1 Tax=Patellaria atrata CBS 101060 TaxID=1346257 RepID=A0A9P4S2R7_9PEZI|nr:hypothetical protein M501DRAFT_942486 [Patellaria atrata CBS 101060]